MKINFTTNGRGFIIGEFKDLYGKECSIQSSSLATDTAIWLGCDEVAHVDGHCLARMHLNRKQVKKLIKTLQYFVDHGNLPEPTE